MPLMICPAGGSKVLVPVDCSTDGTNYTGTCSDTLDHNDATYISAPVGVGVTRGSFEVVVDLGDLYYINRLIIHASYTKGADPSRSGRILAMNGPITIQTWDFYSTVAMAEYSSDVSSYVRYIFFQGTYFNSCEGGCDAGILRLAEIIVIGR